MTATETSGRVLYSRKDPRKLVTHRPALHSYHAARTSRTRPAGTNPCLALRRRLAEVSDDADAPALPARCSLAAIHWTRPRRPLHVCEAFLASEPPTSGALPFVFISAADVFRPWVPAHYTETKRDPGTGIAALIARTLRAFMACICVLGWSPRAPAAAAEHARSSPAGRVCGPL
ncbi:hypothetical protein B0H11DRAFT_2220268 [Mycena galericulata]|nr:hypothetical protein B0H11DRAFT_2220268 [Mycena galericulata]